MRELVEELIPVQVHQMDLTKTIRIRALLPKDVQESFKAFLQKNAHVFV